MLEVNKYKVSLFAEHSIPRCHSQSCSEDENRSLGNTLVAYEHRPWGAPVSAFFTRMLSMGFSIERLQDNTGAAVACPAGEAVSMLN